MNLIMFLKALVLGIVEGLTEFVPISSTGHLILAGNWLHFTNETAKVFDIFIQLGAILAVVYYYRKTIFSMIIKLPSDPATQKFGFNLLIAFLPAAVIGFLLHKSIKLYLFNPVTVALALVAGGIAIYWIEAKKPRGYIENLEQITFRVALAIGIAQVFALIPGVSRSGATIMGGLLAGASRKTATEFSFFLAIPTMLAATLFELLKSFGSLSLGDLQLLAVGFAAAFISGLWVVKWLIGFVSHHDFKPFAYYRIVFGGILLAYYITQR